jgi:hypothetical protein
MKFPFSWWLLAGSLWLVLPAVAAPPVPAAAAPPVPAPVAASTAATTLAAPSATRATPVATPRGKATDHVELDQTTITGNRELPNVMVIVPWKESAPGDPGKAGRSLLDDALEPLDREEFRRELQYGRALRGKPVQPKATPSGPATPAPTVTGGNAEPLSNPSNP